MVIVHPLVGFDGLHVTYVRFDHDVGLLTVGVELTRTPMGCPSCGVIAHSHGRSGITLVDNLGSAEWRRLTGAARSHPDDAIGHPADELML